MPNWDYGVLDSVETELSSYGIEPGVDFEVVDWRIGEVANHDENSGFEAGGLLHEFVKSFGFRRDSETEDWSWSVENIGTSFKEDPIWTTLDYLTLVVPMAKVGIAATRVGRGVGSASKVMKKAAALDPDTIKDLTSFGAQMEPAAASRFLTQVQSGRRARMAEKVAGWVGKPGPGFAEAVELEMRHGVGRSAASRWFSSNVARRGMVESWDYETRSFVRHVDDEWEQLLTLNGGGDPFEARALYDVMRREAISEKAMYERMGEELIRHQNKVLKTPEAREEFGRMIAEGIDVTEVLRTLGKDEAFLAHKLDDFRLRIHEKSYQLGLLSRKTYEEGLKSYWPRVWQELEAARLMQASVKGRKVSGTAGISGREAGERLRHSRTLTPDDVELIEATEGAMRRALDPAAGISKLMEVGSFVAGQSYLQRMAGSSLLKEGRDVLTHINDIARTVPADELDKVLTTRFYRTWPKRNIDHILKETDYAGGVGMMADTEVDALVTKYMGWRRMDDAFSAAGIKGYLANIPPSMRGLYMDPMLARDLSGMNAFVEALPASLRQIYMTAMSHFKASKTAYNPATHIRNWFGALVFHHLTVGGLGPFQTGFRRGWKALDAGANPHATPEELRDYKEIMESGFANSSFDREIQQGIAGALKTHDIDVRRVTALDWLKIIPGLRKGKGAKAIEPLLETASWAERKYRFVDEVAKADAFLIRRDHWIKELSKDPNWNKRTGYKRVLVGEEVVAGEPIKVTRLVNQRGDELTLGDKIKVDGMHGEGVVEHLNITDKRVSADFDMGDGEIVRWRGGVEEAIPVHRRPGQVKKVTETKPGPDRTRPIFERAEIPNEEIIRLEARARAAQDVVRFQPVFHQNSPFTDLVRNVIPFSSFTTEAVRVWSNALKEKPHLAYFYNHMAEAMSQMLGSIAGFDTADLEAAKMALPEYAQHKKMVVLPFRVDGKPTFLDLSYMLPMGNISESAEHEASFFDRIHMDPFSANPFLSAAYAAKTGKDPFSGQPIEPRFLEQQLQVDVPAKGIGRQALGMAEHMMKMALPPLIPPGYAGMNLYELARGHKHPTSGADLEEGLLRTIAANAFGFRTYEADVEAQLLNVSREARRSTKEIGVQWRRWQFGHANGRPGMMEKSLREIRLLRQKMGDSPEEADKYVLASMKRREKGKWRGVSSRKMMEVLRRSEGVTSKTPEDLRMMSELVARLEERNISTRLRK
ncbi:MAG: hypothetical protein ACYTFQ_00345 [Planctomycetota bacterium]